MPDNIGADGSFLTPGPPQPSITCPVCGMTSYHPKDIEFGWCGNCHAYTSASEAMRSGDQYVEGFPNGDGYDHVCACSGVIGESDSMVMVDGVPWHSKCWDDR